MDKIKKVTIEYEDLTVTVEGKEAEKWLSHVHSVSSIARVHGCSPFDDNPINWRKYKSPTT